MKLFKISFKDCNDGKKEIVKPAFINLYKRNCRIVYNNKLFKLEEFNKIQAIDKKNLNNLKTN